MGFLACKRLLITGLLVLTLFLILGSGVWIGLALRRDSGPEPRAPEERDAAAATTATAAACPTCGTVNDADAKFLSYNQSVWMGLPAAS